MGGTGATRLESEGARSRTPDLWVTVVAACATNLERGDARFLSYCYNIGERDETKLIKNVQSNPQLLNRIMKNFPSAVSLVFVALLFEFSLI